MRTAGEILAEFGRVFQRPENVLHPDRAHLAFRKRLIKEEFKEVGDELDKAMRGGLTSEVRLALAKELADLSYVVYGTAVEFGIDLDEAVSVVHDSNMTKLDDNGEPLLRDDGKILKSDNYQPPDDIELAVAAGLPIEGACVELA